VADRLGAVAVLLEPRARPAVHLRDQVRLLVVEAGLQHVGEEVVVSVPAAPVVERDEEEVGALQALECGAAAVLARHGVAQVAGEAGEHRSPQEEVANLRRLAVQHLLDQVVDDVAVVAGERRDEGGGVVAALQ